jgi:tungstate transport system substrate-binding protein
MKLRLLLSLALALAACDDPRPAIVLATTTSVQDSGLLDALLPAFVEESGVRVQTVAVGSGAALRMGREGDADVLLTHAPDGERELVEAGAVVRRVPFMKNFFVLAGPAADPARIAEADSVAAALARIHAARAPWVSRADDSGTHRKEQALWRGAGLDPDERWPGFHSTGSGMGFSLQVAGERGAYLLSDYGTYLAFRERTGLVVYSKRERALRNVYSVMPVRDEPHSRALEAYLVRPDVQERIAGFGADRFEEPLFTPLHPDG